MTAFDSRQSAPHCRLPWNAVPLVVLVTIAGCERGGDPAPITPIPVDVLADSGVSIRLRAVPRASVRSAPAPVRPARAVGAGPTLPDAGPDTAVPETAPAARAVDDRLKPPILRAPGRLVLPAELARVARSHRLEVELDLRIDEEGAVSEASWAGGAVDSALVQATRRCAIGMKFYPALRRGVPVAVWSRQRFELLRGE